MDVEKIVAEYDRRLYRDYETFGRQVRDAIVAVLADRGIAHVTADSRAKAPRSLRNKILAKQYSDPLRQIDDLAGVRIVVQDAKDVETAAAVIRSGFAVDELNSGYRPESLAEDAFGYRSLHLVVSLDPRVGPNSTIDARFVALRAEVQLRTVLEHAWATLSHEVSYKRLGEAPKELRRRLARLSALLELADSELEALRLEAREAAKARAPAIGAGGQEVDLNVDSLKEYLRASDVLGRYVEAGLRAGMWKNPHALYLHDLPLAQLFGALRALGSRTVADFRNLAEELLATADARLAIFAKAARERGLPFSCVGVDLLMVLLSVAYGESLPWNFDPAHTFRAEVLLAVRDTRALLRKS